MSDVTHELECHVTRELSGDRYFCCCAELRIREADHLAELERVRVETLREVKTAVMHLPVVGRLAGTDSTLAAVHVLGSIDRLINAATTGDTDD